MDEGTATVIASVVAASGSVAVAWITTRQKPAPPVIDLKAGQLESLTPLDVAGHQDGPPPGPAADNARNHFVARCLLWFLYFLTGLLLVICGAENDVDQVTANFSAGFAIMTGIAAYLIRRRLRSLHRA
jgi:hypothetical protein